MSSAHALARHRGDDARWPRLARLLLAAALGCVAAAHGSAAPTVNVIVSEPAGIYHEAAVRVSHALSQKSWTVALSTPEQLSPPGSDLTVAIGTRALEAALVQPARPVLALLVPFASYERLADSERSVSALYLDQPVSRQLQLLRLALPGLASVGVPLGPSSGLQQQTLASAARDTGVGAESRLIAKDSELHAALSALAERNQAFLLLPDPLVAKRSTLQNLLLHTYRLKKPVLAYSASLGQAGALLALYATPAQLGDEAADWISASWSNGKFTLGPPRHPRSFSIAVNRTVARSLDLVLPDEDVLARQLRALP